MSKIVRISYILYIVVLLSLPYSISSAQPVLVLNAVGLPPLNTPENNGFMDEVSREALESIGYQLVIDRLPAERALRSANAGIIDGEISRIYGLEKNYPNLIRVPEKIMDWEFFAFSKNVTDMGHGWDELKNKNIAFITGWKIIENSVPEAAIVTKTKNSQQLFRLLDNDRTDYIIYEKWGGKYIIKEQHIENVSIIEPSLVKKEMFMYLHKKHAELVPDLTQSLKDMKNNGRYQELLYKHLSSGVDEAVNDE